MTYVWREGENVESHAGAYCAHCPLPYRLEDLVRVASSGLIGGARYVCGWHYAMGKR